VPFFAQIRARPFFWPILASSWNQTSIRRPFGKWPMWAWSVAAKLDASKNLAGSLRI
jgi:hypothetical protein